MSSSAFAGGIVDTLVFGDAGSERDHAETISGLLGESARCLLPTKTGDCRGGSMTFTLKVKPDAPNYFTVRFSGDDAVESRMFLVVDGLMIGYLHLGDIDLLEPGTGGPQSPGRFFYRMTPLPGSLTKGHQEIHCEIRSTGAILGYGTTFDRFPKPMT